MAGIDQSTLWRFANMILGRGKRDTTTREQATFLRTDQDGTQWVRLNGSSDETPVNGRTLASAKAGDIVEWSIDDGRLSIIGNATTPAVGSSYVDNEVKVVTRQVEAIRAEVVETAELVADKASIGQLEAESARISDLEADTADIDTIRANAAKVQNLTAAQLEADHATIGTLDTTYMHADMANADVAWINNGTIRDGAIVSAMINDVSANKLTAGTINGSVINVTNLNADNITAGTINGQRIGQGSLSLDKLSENVYTEAEVDTIVDGLNDRIDGAIETHTGTAVPTLNNSPASGWNTTSLKDEHVGDVYYVVNSQSQQNGYCYRFTKSGSTYSWQLIKDSDVTAALSRLTTAEGKITTFDSDISTLKTTTGTLTTKTESLETRMSDAEEDILDKVDTTTFNEVSDTVDQHSLTISQHTTAISNKADGSTVTAVTNRVSKNEQDITGLTTTLGELQETVEAKADGSTVSSISNRLNTVSNTVDGHTQTLTNVQNTLSTKADGTTVSTLSTRVSNVSDTVDGHTTQLSSITSTQTTMQSTLDKTVKSSVQLWYSKADTTAPNKPTSQVTSTSTSGNAWRTVVPAYSSSYPHYYYCWQYEYVDGTYGWSAVVRDIAMGESQATARTADSTANANIKSSVQLWFTKANSTAPNKPTSVVSTSNANTANAWNLVVPVWNSSYPHYFYCYQQQKGDGTYQWTDVVYDRATSEAQQLANTTSTSLTTLQEDYATYKQTTTENVSAIGTRMTTAEGKISTAETNITQNATAITSKVSSDDYNGQTIASLINQSADSVKIAAGHINLQGAVTISDLASDAQSATLNSNISVGGRNLLQDSKFTTAFGTNDTSWWVRDGLSATLSDNKLVIDGSVAATGNKRVYQSTVRFSHVTDTTYTFSCDIVATAACQVSFGRRYGTTSNYGVTFDVTTTSQRMSGTYTATSVGAFCISEVSNSATVTISNPKLEIGNVATDWTPAPEDTPDQMTWYGTCSTASSTAEKAVACDGFELQTGARIAVKSTTVNTANAPTLNVNGTGAIATWYNNAVSSSSNPIRWGANATINFFYDGSVWVLDERPPSYSPACSTAAGTRAKAPSVVGALVVNGTRLSVRFSTANTYTDNSVQINLASTGAYSVYQNNAVTSTTNTLLWDANTILTFVAQGTYWHLLSRSDASKTATSYVTEITGQNGIMVHPSTDDDTGVRITSDVDILRNGYSVMNVGTQGDTSGNTDAGVTIYDGTTSQNVVAKFDSDEVSLGANSTSSTIDMCGGAFKFDVDTSDPNNEAATIWLDQDAVDPSTSSAPVLRILSGTSSVGRGIVIRGTAAAQWPVSIVNYSGSTTTEQVGLGSLGVLTPNIKFSSSGMGTIDAYNGILVTTSIGSNSWSTPAGTVLWSGAYHMTASHTATLTHNVSTCPTGIVLHWQAYVSGSAANQDQCYCFVPKTHVSGFAGGGVQMPLMTSGFGNVGCKYVYIYDDRVVGAANNNQSGTGSSITYNNAYWVLTQIIAV